MLVPILEWLTELTCRPLFPFLADVCAFQVAEGVPTTRAAVKLAKKLEVNHTPIMSTLCSIIDGEMEPKSAIAHLMSQPLRAEHDESFGDPVSK